MHLRHVADEAGARFHFPSVVKGVVVSRMMAERGKKCKENGVVQALVAEKNSTSVL